MIIIIGLAGSGKSTQAQLLSQKLGAPWLSVGALLRQKADRSLSQVLMAGEIIDDDILLPLLDIELQKMSADTHQLVLDGSPRTLRQARWLVEKTKQGEINDLAAIHLIADQKTAKERLLKRARPDDNDEAIARRFREYKEAIIPIAGYLKTEGVPVHEVDGDLPIEETAELINKALAL